jgi:hypothetical protein
MLVQGMQAFGILGNLAKLANLVLATLPQSS